MASIDVLFLLAPLFFGISFVYSSVGFGGGSSYIAILILAGVSLFTVPQVALVLNIIVASIALINFSRAGHLLPKFSVPFLSSIPFAFVAGLMQLPQQNLALIFGGALFSASTTLLISGRWRNRAIRVRPYNAKMLVLIGVPIGAALGAVAGLVGIGGGIWLSPILILTGLAGPKQAAGTASLFILANSLSGFAAHSISKQLDYSLLVPLAFVVLAGALIGSRAGAFKFDHDKIRIIVGAIVAAAGVMIVLKLIPLG